MKMAYPPWRFFSNFNITRAKHVAMANVMNHSTPIHADLFSKWIGWIIHVLGIRNIDSEVLNHLTISVQCLKRHQKSEYAQPPTLTYHWSTGVLCDNSITICQWYLLFVKRPNHILIICQQIHTVAPVIECNTDSLMCSWHGVVKWHLLVDKMGRVSEIRFVHKHVTYA